jgi:hypothetical protein
MRWQSNRAYEYAATRRGPRAICEGGDTQSLSSAAYLAPCATEARKKKLLWLLARPLTLSLLGLAFAVVLWGLQYKVSLYHPHPNHTARVGVAKLWVGSQRAVLLKNSWIKSLAPPAPELHLLTTRYVSASDWSDCARGCDAELVINIGSLSRQSTPRSPPAI